MVLGSMSKASESQDLIRRVENVAGAEAKPLRDYVEGLEADLRFSQDRLDQLSQELVETKKIMKDWEKRKNEMLSVCAHDLKSPTSTILSFIDILRSEGRQLPAKDVEKIHERIERAGQHMWSLVNNLLDTTQLDAGKMTIAKEPTLLSHLCREALDHAKAKAEAKEIKLEMKVLPSELKVSMDQEKGMQIINNLISNALKFTPRGGSIELQVASQSNKTALTVKDSGQGIPKDELKVIFDKFQQTSTRSTEGERGTGLGLSIVHQLVELHAGKISVTSELGKGTSFILSFPVAESSKLLKLFSGKI
jgi:signal transduction histidine kinase